MDTYSLAVLGILVISLVTLFFLSYLLRALIIKQVDDQMKSIIPIKCIRKRVGITMKWRK
tara:strand:+ start:463 stop:642 length:180 start_codon:yes stop_codon:yes gene_type:complete